MALTTDDITIPQSTAEDRNAAAVTSFQMEVEAAALVRLFCITFFCSSWILHLTFKAVKALLVISNPYGHDLLRWLFRITQS